MAKYNLYAGLGGGFGGARYDHTEEFDTQEDAENEARRLAIEEYQSYEGYHGILSYEDVAEEYCEENGLDFDNPDSRTEDDRINISNMYLEEVEGWIDYKAVLTSEDTELDELYIEER